MPISTTNISRLRRPCIDPPPTLGVHHIVLLCCTFRGCALLPRPGLAYILRPLTRPLMTRHGRIMMMMMMMGMGMGTRSPLMMKLPMMRAVLKHRRRMVELLATIKIATLHLRRREVNEMSIWTKMLSSTHSVSSKLYCRTMSFPIQAPRDPPTTRILT